MRPLRRNRRRNRHRGEGSLQRDETPRPPCRLGKPENGRLNGRPQDQICQEEESKVNRNNPPRSSEALIERIRHLSAEAEWSVDELRDVLTDAGIDPDQFIKDIKIRIKELLKVSPERPERKAEDEYDTLPLLPRLRRITGLKATA